MTVFDEFLKDLWQFMYDRHITLTKTEFAKRVDTAYPVFYKFLRGESHSRHIAEKIADYFGLVMVYTDGKYRLMEKEKIKIG